MFFEIYVGNYAVMDRRKDGSLLYMSRLFSGNNCCNAATLLVFANMHSAGQVRYDRKAENGYEFTTGYLVYEVKNNNMGKSFVRLKDAIAYLKSTGHSVFVGCGCGEGWEDEYCDPDGIAVECEIERCQ